MERVDALEIIRQLEADPSLRTQLRAVLLTEDILQLPALVAANSRDIQALKEVVASVERRLESLEGGQQALEAGQSALEAGQSALEAGQEALRKEVGRLSEVVGGTVEEDAVSVLVTVIGRRGWAVSGTPQPWEDGGEIDVLGEATTDEGRRVSLLVEAKTRLRPADVRRFAGRIGSLVSGAGIEGDYIAYVYGLRVYTGVDETAASLGLGVLCPDGERVAGTVRTG